MHTSGLRCFFSPQLVKNWDQNKSSAFIFSLGVFIFRLRFSRLFFFVSSVFMVSGLFITFIVWTVFVGLEIAERWPQIDSEALLNSMEIRRPGFPSKSCQFAQCRECD